MNGCARAIITNFSAHRKISDFVGDILDGVRDDLNAHVDEVSGCHFKDTTGEGFAITIDLLHTHGAHDGPLVTLQSLLGHVNDLLGGLGAKLFGSSSQHLIVGPINFDLKLGGCLRSQLSVIFRVQLRELLLPGPLL